MFELVLVGLLSIVVLFGSPKKHVVSRRTKKFVAKECDA